MHFCNANDCIGHIPATYITINDSVGALTLRAALYCQGWYFIWSQYIKRIHRRNAMNACRVVLKAGGKLTNMTKCNFISIDWIASVTSFYIMTSLVNSKKYSIDQATTKHKHTCGSSISHVKDVTLIHA